MRRLEKRTAGSVYGHNLNDTIIKDVLKKAPTDLIPVGSLGRNYKPVNDLDFITLKPIDKTVDKFDKSFNIKRIIEEGPQQSFFTIDYDGTPVEVNLFKATKETLPYVFFTYAFPKRSTISFRKKAKSMGYKLTRDGFYDKKGKLIHVKNYMEIFDYLDIPKRTPKEQTIREKEYGHIKDTEEALKMIRKKGGCNECSGGIDFSYPIKRSFQVIANAYRRSNCDSRSRPLQLGEFHYGCQNWEGPGTVLGLSNSEPINGVDDCSRTHDYAYNASKQITNQAEREAHIRAADIAFLKCIEQYPNDSGYTAAKIGIAGKNKLENLSPSLLRSLLPSHFGQ